MSVHCKKTWDEMSLEERVEWLYKKSDEDTRRIGMLERWATRENEQRHPGAFKNAVQWLLRKHKEDGK